MSSNIIQEPSVNVVCLGVGYMSGVIAVEAALAGYTVAGITKGPYLPFLCGDTQCPSSIMRWGTGWVAQPSIMVARWDVRVRGDIKCFLEQIRILG